MSSACPVRDMPTLRCPYQILFVFLLLLDFLSKVTHFFKSKRNTNKIRYGQLKVGMSRTGHAEDITLCFICQ